MALTVEGRALTESHRRAQLAIAARAAVVGSALWPRLDVADLDRSSPRWLAANLAAAERFYRESVSVAAAYVPMYRNAELGSAAGAVVTPAFDRQQTALALNLAGPVRIKMLVGGGMGSADAHTAARTKYAGILRRMTLSGGRELVDLTTKADQKAIGWRRVTDGDPCAFCAMLASRGPVYGTKSIAERIGGNGLRYHGHCGCTGEIVYGEWKPTELEQRFIDEYEKAAQEANDAGYSRTQDSVLHRLRSGGDFRDSPTRRNN